MKNSEAEAYILRALKAEVGIIVETEDVERARNALTRARTRLNKQFPGTTQRLADTIPYKPGEVWLIRRPANEDEQ